MFRRPRRGGGWVEAPCRGGLVPLFSAPASGGLVEASLSCGGPAPSSLPRRAAGAVPPPPGGGWVDAPPGSCGFLCLSSCVPCSPPARKPGTLRRSPVLPRRLFWEVVRRDLPGGGHFAGVPAPPPRRLPCGQPRTPLRRSHCQNRPDGLAGTSCSAGIPAPSPAANAAFFFIGLAGLTPLPTFRATSHFAMPTTLPKSASGPAGTTHPAGPTRAPPRHERCFFLYWP